ncbi:MAG TPA: AraC family transcriptional regulator [Firmicutes bacterium]|nr:AraC family transcriptional regulator [Bacillota bacterium]
MEWIATMQKALIYIEEHLKEDINYEDVAKNVYTSSYEFHRAFCFLTGMTPNTYIRKRRLSLAGKEIVETDSKIADIAVKYGYETPESFTKAFTRFHGVAPKMARKNSSKLALFNPLVIKITLEGGKSMDYRIVQTEEQKFIALVRSFQTEITNDDENSDIPDFWGECFDKKLVEPLRDLRPAGKKDLYGLCSPAKESEDTFEYGIGVILNHETVKFDVAEMEKRGYRIWIVKAGTYAVFDCIGEDSNCISDTWTKFYKEFLPQMGYETVGETDYEIYFEKGRKDRFCELWIPVIKK